MPKLINADYFEADDESRWQAVLDRDHTADGHFYYSVKSTGVYCRPSCPTRAAKRENVRFHLNREEAELAGFRPCKRCKPGQPSLREQHIKKVTEICRLLETAECEPSLSELAAIAGLSPFYFHRIFRVITGLTPKAYATAQRNHRVRKQLTKNKSVTTAIYDAGYNSSSRFYEKSPQLLGMTPSDYRSGGPDSRIRFALGECSLGSILAAASDIGICAIALGDDPDLLARELQDRFPQAEFIGGDSEFEQWIAKVIGFVEAPAIGLDLPLDMRGTAFQQRVWQALRQIPAGEKVSYTDIAQRIGAPKAVRAVAGACAANTLAVAIPCHRVVRTDGNLSGYRWGVERKAKLLLREQQS
ncbi:AraC family transcriptional regulator, regulatory protein of adaptative response / methylated-DNA-[protein]-cysteine methyltransferase [Nitrosomonas sp. Nm51]|uniref:bifunctional DNA-binding transcriptional regulator/O6-methylguanine-DNA methyltransferase Ada n=1 Tax=Nitrosomonas sp. Nm51 TaxID=133720 RepID=UPI0008B0BA3E|nr:bifunctional DNA-binding transcriptional regulator/O6-methylguanine-DNA methyltransferase Ada [Nitrosomonas sp. Nm51]SER71863.1 AraC family transcriptional regulator, regulatory protein of adaptative response / methylated-DNA-[protein]-cysteine methyltransferase [Nitrosomonas sp. Nm51]